MSARGLAVLWVLIASNVLAEEPSRRCALPPQADPLDPAAAQAYLAVAQEELASGETQSALDALRKALQHAPGDEALRTQFQTLCAQVPSPVTFDEGMRLYQEGEYGRAATVFAQARARSPSAELSMMEGICRYELRDDEAARRLLRQALGSPDTADSARLFLGLLALRRGDGTSAAANFNVVSDRTDSPLRTEALSLLRIARQSGRLVLTVLAQGGYDSNSDLLPDGASSLPVTSGSPAVDVSVAMLIRPEGESGPYARVIGTLRKDLLPATFEQASVLAGAGWQQGPNARHIAASYDFELNESGGELFFLSHRLGLMGRYSEGALGVGLGASSRWVSYRLPGFEPWSALRLEPLVEGRVRLGRHLVRLSARYTRALARESAYSFHAPGVELAGILDFTPLRFLLEPMFETRSYDAVDPNLGVARAETTVGATAGIEWDLGDRWTAQAAFSLRHTLANAPVQTDRWNVWTGLAYTLEVF
jgi:Tfp pilus assembly protein PilF